MGGETVNTPEQIIPDGWKTYGPDHPDYPNAPKDWDTGPYMCRDGGHYYMRGHGWEHGLGCSEPEADWDRIAYKPEPNP